MNIQLNIVTCLTYPEKFIRNNIIVATFVPTSVVIVTLSYFTWATVGPKRSLKFPVRDLKYSYLLAYLLKSCSVRLCAAVVSMNRRECRLSQPISLTSPSGSLASVTSQHLGLGTVECPWKIGASPGQRIAVSLRYFRPDRTSTPTAAASDARTGRQRADAGDRQGSNCYELATVHGAHMTAGKSRSITTCDGQRRGNHELFTSTTNDITIQVVGRLMLKTLGRFIISYRGQSTLSQSWVAKLVCVCVCVCNSTQNAVADLEGAEPAPPPPPWATD